MPCCSSGAPPPNEAVGGLEDPREGYDCPSVRLLNGQSFHPVSGQQEDDLQKGLSMGTLVGTPGGSV